jgi:hypothetical protein
MSEKSILDARLAEIDRRLRTIQTGLEPAARAAQAAQAAQAVQAERVPQAVVPPEAAPVPKRLADAAPSEAGALVAQLRALLDAHERLLASARELTDRREPAAPGPSVSVSAGPFASTDALRRFERALQTLPDVRSAVVREYEGADRAIVDVQLSEPTT